MKKIFLFFSLLTLLVIVLALPYYFTYTQLIEDLKTQKWLPTLDIYVPEVMLNRGQKMDLALFIRNLKNLGFRKREVSKRLFEKDYSLLTKDECREKIDLEEKDNVCLFIYNKFLQILVLDQNLNISNILKVSSNNQILETKSLNFHPQLLAQTSQGKFVLQNFSTLSQTPLYCIHSTLAIEDHSFLDHKGFNLKAILRAFTRNLLEGRYVQGGSTITQQLVKNYFLTNEKTIKRKIKELFLSILLELKASKDQILETYLNIIYMGQKKSYEIRGFNSASYFYFGKPLSSLNLSECALLSAVIRSPGTYNPFRHPERSLKRRNQVLQKMKNKNWINENQLKKASSVPLPHRFFKIHTNVFPPSLSQSIVEFVHKNHSQKKGLKVFVNIDLQVQKWAEDSLREGLKHLEKKFPKLKEKTLQASLISIHIPSAKVLALVGGRDFKISQFNRVLKAKRQIGSLMKPFIYLAGFKSLEINPLTPLNDKPFEYSYNKKTWRPKNYKNKFFGNIPLFSSLIYSLNASTARFGLEKVGLENILSEIQKLDLHQNLEKLPSIVLGAFTLTPYEVAQMYLPLARQGLTKKIAMIDKILDKNDKVLWESSQKQKKAFDSLRTALVLSILKQNMIHGTGQLAYWQNFRRPSAGKTGTTNNSKDSWFVGFTPDVLTVVWVGYDDNTPTELTGSSAALLLWLQFMKKVRPLYEKKDFLWPQELQKVSFFQNIKTSKVKKMVELYIRKENKDEVLKLLKFWYEKAKENSK